MNDRYIIIALIGNTPDDQIDANINDGYYQPIFANLIRDFAIDIYNIKKESVKILAIGKEQNYSVYTYSNNKYYFKLDAENTFQIDIKQKNTNFQYFTEFNSAIDQICKMISNNKNKKVILFLDDHGDDGYFAQIHYFHLYEITMKFNNTSFLIFNDSCYSGSFIDFVESYNDMVSLITSNNLLGIKAQLLFAFKNIFEYAIEKVGFNNSQKKVLELIDFYQSIKIDEEQALDLIKSNSFLNEVKIDTTQLYKLIEIGFKNNEQINIFKTMINFYGDVTTDEKDEFKYYKNIFNITNFNIFINLSKGNIPEFIKKLNVFYVIKDSINFDLQPNKHVEIITSTDNLHKSLSFPSIRVNNSIKISPGGPAMGSFIKALFIKNDPKSINFEEIEKEISKSDDGTIYYPLRTTESIKNGKKERQWIHLYPKHYKLSDKNNDVKYSFTYSKKLKQKIATLRAISFLNVQKLTEAAKIINNKVNSAELQPFTDTYGSIFAISALLNEYKDDPNEMIVNCLMENPVINSYKPNIINSYCFILDLSFRISNENPKLMTGVIINILEKAVKQAIKKKIDFIIEKSNSGKNSSENFTNKIFLHREISDLLINQGKILTEFKDNEFPFLKQIEKVIISFISIPQVAFAAIIASSHLFKKIDLTTINEKTLNYIETESNNIFHDEDLIYNHFLTNINKCKNEEDIRRFAEYYLLEMIDASFVHIYSIFDAQFKCESMKIVSYSLTSFTATSIVDVFNYYLENEKNESFIKHIIGPIEQIVNQNNIPNFFIPTILSLMPKETVIYALYMSLSNIENDWFNSLLEMIKIVKDDDSFKEVYNELYSLAKEKLSDQKYVKTSIQYQKSTINMEKIISNEIEKAIEKLYKLQEKSMIKARDNISKQMDINIIEEQIKLYVDNIICNETIKSKFDMYLKESKNEILNIEKHQINLLIDYDKIPTEKSIFNESILDIQNICERASKELITVAHLFKISDESRNKTNSFLSKKIEANASIELPVIVMVARAFNIVEMTPIIDILPQFIYAFDQSEGEEPNLRELMALLSANICILSPKDEKRQCLKIVPLTNNEKIEDIEKIDSDSYDYNDDDDDDELLFSTLKAKSLNKAIPHRKMIYSENNSEILKYYEYQMDYCEIKKARDLLKLGQSSWPNDAWKAFLYCFNLRLKDLEIQFNLSDDYDTSFCPFKIDEGINVVLNFYPITRIHEIFQNKEKFHCFIGQYSNKHEEIIRAFIRSFDDVDLIVTSLYLRKRTYFDRTLEKLKIIYDYPYSKTSKK